MTDFWQEAQRQADFASRRAHQARRAYHEGTFAEYLSSRIGEVRAKYREFLDESEDDGGSAGNPEERDEGNPPLA